MAKRFNPVTIGLLLVLGTRLAAHVEQVMTSQNFGAVTAFILYLIPVIGVMLRKRWGPAMSGVLGVLDLVMILIYLQASNMIGAAAVDGAIICLSYLDYRRIAKSKKGSLGVIQYQ